MLGGLIQANLEQHPERESLLKPAVKIIAFVPASENMPDGKAQKPGDVQIAMSGKSMSIGGTGAIAVKPCCGTRRCYATQT